MRLSHEHLYWILDEYSALSDSTSHALCCMAEELLIRRRQEEMATITSKQQVNRLIRDNGHYDDDPAILKIVEYTNAFNGNLAWGLIYQGEDLNKYKASQHVINPREIFLHRDDGCGAPSWP